MKAWLKLDNDDKLKLTSGIISGLSRHCSGPLSVKLTRDKKFKEYLFPMNVSTGDTTVGDSAYQQIENTKE